jgi:predicted RNase H-like HicB family nuclease
MSEPLLTAYIQSAMAGATYDKLEDGSFCGRIPVCPGVIAFEESLERCREELQSVLEGWIILGLRSGDPMPVIDAIDLNEKAEDEPVAAV